MASKGAFTLMVYLHYLTQLLNQYQYLHIELGCSVILRIVYMGLILTQVPIPMQMATVSHLVPTSVLIWWNLTDFHGHHYQSQCSFSE